MRVRELMTTDIKACEPGDSLNRAGADHVGERLRVRTRQESLGQGRWHADRPRRLHGCLHVGPCTCRDSRLERDVENDRGMQSERLRGQRGAAHAGVARPSPRGSREQRADSRNPVTERHRAPRSANAAVRQEERRAEARGSGRDPRLNLPAAPSRGGLCCGNLGALDRNGS